MCQTPVRRPSARAGTRPRRRMPPPTEQGGAGRAVTFDAKVLQAGASCQRTCPHFARLVAHTLPGAPPRTAELGGRDVAGDDTEGRGGPRRGRASGGAWLSCVLLPRERGEPAEVARHLGQLPRLVDVRGLADAVDQIDRPVAEDLVGDVDAVHGLRVADLGSVHAPSCAATCSTRNPHASAPTQ